MPVDELLAPRPWTPTKYEMFPNGDLLMTTGGHWQWEFDWGPEGATPIEGLFEKVDRWLMPSEDGQPYFYASQGWGNMISAKSKYPEAAFEYVKSVNSPEDYCNRIATYASVSPRDDVKDVCLAYKEAVNGKLVDSEVRLLNGRYFFHFAPGLDYIVDEVAQLTEEILLGKLTAEEAAERFAQDNDGETGGGQG